METGQVPLPPNNLFILHLPGNDVTVYENEFYSCAYCEVLPCDSEKALQTVLEIKCVYDDWGRRYLEVKNCALENIYWKRELKAQKETNCLLGCSGSVSVQKAHDAEILINTDHTVSIRNCSDTESFYVYEEVAVGRNIKMSENEVLTSYNKAVLLSFEINITWDEKCW